MPFELPDLTVATLTSVTPRVERHGDDHVPAVSFGLKIEAPNTMLDRLSATLRETLYKPVPDQNLLPEVEPSTPLLRTRGIESLSLAGALEGWTLNVDHGIDEQDPIAFGGCKVDRFKVSPKEGGSVELLMRIGTSDVDADKLGLMSMKNGQEISITLAAPAKGDPIDGSQDAFDRDHPPIGDGPLFGDADDEPDATDAFVAAHGEGATA